MKNKLKKYAAIGTIAIMGRASVPAGAATGEHESL